MNKKYIISIILVFVLQLSIQKFEYNQLNDKQTIEAPSITLSIKKHYKNLEDVIDKQNNNPTDNLQKNIDLIDKINKNK